MTKHISSAAAIIIVGDELLRGSTIDTNGPYLARRLSKRGMRVREIRNVGDSEEAIASAVLSMSGQNDWVLVVGGLGPTHDDVTALGIARGFDLEMAPNEAAIASLASYHAPEQIPAGRLEGAKLPVGAQVYPDLISGSCGFKLRNVIALPGDPTIVKHLWESVAPMFEDSPPLVECSLKASLLEHEVSVPLRDVQARHAEVQIGCYPYFPACGASLNFVLRSTSAAALGRCKADLQDMLSHIVDSARSARVLCQS